MNNECCLLYKYDRVGIVKDNYNKRVLAMPNIFTEKKNVFMIRQKMELRKS